MATKFDPKQNHVMFFHEDRTPLLGRDGVFYSPTGERFEVQSVKDMEMLNQKRLAVTSAARRWHTVCQEQSSIQDRIAQMEEEFARERDARLQELDAKLKRLDEKLELIEDLPVIDDAPPPVEQLELTDIEKDMLAKIAIKTRTTRKM